MYERVVDLCQKYGMSIRQLERKLEIGNGTISRWKNSDPTLKTLLKVANYFQINLDELVYGDKPSD